jgi:hypothetical protein
MNENREAAAQLIRAAYLAMAGEINKALRVAQAAIDIMYPPELRYGKDNEE